MKSVLVGNVILLSVLSIWQLARLTFTEHVYNVILFVVVCVALFILVLHLIMTTKVEDPGDRARYASFVTLVAILFTVTSSLGYYVREQKLQEIRRTIGGEIEIPAWSLDPSVVPCRLEDGGLLSDVNDDGRTDFICKGTIFLNTGHAWATSTYKDNEPL
jgi:hypothetical protein